MTVSGVSGAGGYYTGQAASGSETKSIERQISELQKAITEVQNDDSLDEKVKSQQVAAYQAQISQLQAELSKIRQEQAQTNQSPAQEQTVQDTKTDLAGYKEPERLKAGLFMNREV